MRASLAGKLTCKTTAVRRLPERAVQSMNRQSPLDAAMQTRASVRLRSFHAIETPTIPLV
jgi:hypothetical protein